MMNSFTKCAVVCLLILLQNQIAVTSFVSTPKSITPSKTTELTLRCQPETDGLGAILAIHIKKKDDVGGGGKPGGTEGGEEAGAGKSDAPTEGPNEGGVQQQDTGASRAQRGAGEQFVRATITPGNKMTIVPSSDRFKSEGSVVEPAFLSVTIRAPDVVDAGLYECQVTHFDDNGEVQVTTEVTEVREELELTMDSLQLRVQTLEGQLPVIRLIVETMQKTADDKKMLEDSMLALKRENSELTEAVTALTKELQTLKDQVDALTGSGEQTGNTPEQQASTYVNSETFSNDNKKHSNHPQVENQHNAELEQMREKMEELENTRIHVLEEQVENLKRSEGKLEEMVNVLEFKLNTSVETRVSKLEQVNWKGLSESMESVQLKTLPLLMNNITSSQRTVKLLQGEVNAILSLLNLTDQVVNELKLSELILDGGLPDNPGLITGFACYVCGNNFTQKHCNAETSKHVEHCGENQPYCMTDVYQNGTFRRIYKRCASNAECLEGSKLANARCAEETFVTSDAMECHFCCTSPLCNDYVKPSKDLYTVPQ
ncbi:unnamed protein product [Lymnaea stagnalis]|uniref:Uncharacterized protein n=1 Tax=Lymnaea stagnalis TaxID=6523 RepID=A0AAV2IIP5_LYMST